MTGQTAAAITVITVVRNGASCLEETIRSVLGHAGVRYVVVDGGSTDGTLEIIARYADRLAGWCSESDHGIYDAMNKGWRMADVSSRILFLGAGDKLLSLPHPVSDCSSPDSILYGNVLLAGGQVFRASAGFRLRLYNSLHHQALLIPKRLHPDPPFNLAFPHYADFDFNQRLRKMGAQFSFSPELQAYAAPGGVTGDLHLNELLQVVGRNFGPLWVGLSRLGFAAARRVPALRRLRPIR